MITFTRKISGEIPTQIIIDCGGVGYHVNISLHVFFASQDFIKYIRIFK
jgi:Holliday junction DNA helicase RuvA